MTDPFAMACPAAVLAAAKALRATVSNCWPRVREPIHLQEVVLVLSICWLNLHGDEGQHPGQDHEAIAGQLMQTSKMLQAVWSEQSCQPPDKLPEAVRQEPRLRQLFPGAMK